MYIRVSSQNSNFIFYQSYGIYIDVQDLLGRIYLPKKGPFSWVGHNLYAGCGPDA